MCFSYHVYYYWLVFIFTEVFSTPELWEPGTNQFLNNLPPKRDCGTKRVNKELHTEYARTAYHTTCKMGYIYEAYYAAC